MSLAVQGSAHLTAPGQEQDLADLGVAEVALGTLKWLIVVYIFEISKHASVPHALGLLLMLKVLLLILSEIAFNHGSGC